MTDQVEQQPEQEETQRGQKPYSQKPRSRKSYLA